MAGLNFANELENLEYSYSTDVMTGGSDKKMYLYYQLISSLKRADSVDIIVSFLMESGVKMLIAELENGNIVEGESIIPDEVVKQKSKIKELRINPKKALPLLDALMAINEADAIVMGPGSLYTSIIPNLLVEDIVECINKSDAIKIYISNVMTQPGETDNFAVSDHIKTLMKYSGKNSIEYVIANNGTIPNEIKERYLKEGSELVELDYENIKGLGVEIVETDLVKITKGYVKHDSEHLAQVLMTTILDKKLLYDKKRIMEYMYVSKKIKKN